MSQPVDPIPGEPRPWWESRWFVAALILLSAVPLLYPPIPPLVDLFGHLGRYRVQLDINSSPWLGQYYDFKWAPIGNLGVDLLVIPMSKLFGLELGVKLIVLAIPPMMTAGFLWVAREVHHRLPPTALFALPFAYSYPFMFGFVNYALSMALALLAFGFWLRLGRLDKTAIRAVAFVPISFVVFFAHTFGWGMLGLMAFSAEAVRQHDRGIGWLRSALKAAAHALVMALPVLVILDWRGDVQGELGHGWFLTDMKLKVLASVLRDRWLAFDAASVAVIVGAIIFAIVHRRLTLSRNLAFSALVLSAVFVLMPSTVFGSAYADMRLAPFIFAIAALAIRFKAQTDLPLARTLALLGLAFLLARTAATTASMAMAADDQSAKLQALDHVPMGARVASLTGQGCGLDWPVLRNSHLGAMAIVRRDGFSNDQWFIQGTNLLTLRYREPGPLRGRFFADRVAQWLLRIALADRSRAARLAARQIRLYLADRPAALRSKAGSWPAPGLARTGQHPLSGAAMTAPALSIVVPCFNEELCLEELHGRLAAAARAAVAGDYELVLVNDGSRDGSWPRMLKLAARDSRVVAVNLSRNHGHQLALTAGLDVCRGDAVLIIDADLQDPPELLADMLATMRESQADVVYGVRRSRSGETAFKRASAHAFYRLLSRATEVDIPVDAGDFRLISRRALNALMAMPEQARFIRGMVAWIGFKQVPFPYNREARFAGETKYPFRKMVRFAFDAITGFSSAPLKLASHAGLALALGSLLIIVYITYAWLAGDSIQGWTSLMLVVVILGAMQMFVLAVMGQYIGRLYNQAKQRPLYIVQEIAGGEPQAGRQRLGYVAEPIANSDKPGGKGRRPISKRSAAKPRSKA